tara:strand:- start:6255 stop:7091 length:837 start_codon:yes stop_codon:yes gene_type:complete
MIIWIASYPKSGNTWVRSLLSAYLYSNDGFFNFKLLKHMEQFPGKKHFEFFLKDFKDAKKVSEFWIAAQERINLSNENIFFKTHHSLCKIDNNIFTNKSNTKAAIYVVRDPRNVITSISHHYDMNMEEAFNFMTDKSMTLVNRKKYSSVVKIIGNWSDNYNSWKNLNFAPLLIVKYEDLIKDTTQTLKSILNFLSKFMEVKIDENKIINVINSCSFETLAKTEKEEGFAEAVKTIKDQKQLNFFYLGKKNDWKELLNPKIEKKIRESFLKEMKEIGYI